ncbi:MAG TPA: aminoglycoside phosphotransferase family protein [Acidimicrobiia bacterium]|nr:aminoglycoside phosphotransferase family protein [Acidimicrobiia bacterium]
MDQVIAVIEIDQALVTALVSAQFPQWADLPITRVENDGWDNRTFRLGSDMSVRLPSGEDYSAQVAKEHRWLPELAPQLPLEIPVPLAMGVPGHGYPWNWSIYRWLDGDNASLERINDLDEFAKSLAHFLVGLQDIDAANGPAAGKHSFYRGAPVATYDAETRASIATLGDEIPRDLATEVWETAVASRWKGSPVWVHGDVAASNLLVRDGRLSAVIDFGCSCVGDPACDVTIAWTLLEGESRERFRVTLGADAETWARGRGWALWKGLITLVEHFDTSPTQAAIARHVVEEVLADHKA